MQRLADARDAGSLSNRLRARRFRLFERLAAPLTRPLRIIDLGGTPEFWAHRGWADREDVEITLINLEQPAAGSTPVRLIVGDVTDLSCFDENCFDVAFSNSVIEHLYTFERQAAMARELTRLAPRYWLQTPNFWFPMEPHFHVVGWQWMPLTVRRRVIRHVQCGWRGPCPDAGEADAAVREVRLLTRRRLRRLFPSAAIVPERFGGLVKSWIVHAGFPECSGSRESRA